MLTLWFEPDIQWQMPAGASKAAGKAIQCCLALKVWVDLALCQTVGLVELRIELSGLSWAAPDFRTVCCRQRALDLQVHGMSCKEGAHLLGDSSA